jgi:hypothetical protein
MCQSSRRATSDFELFGNGGERQSAFSESNHAAGRDFGSGSAELGAPARWRGLSSSDPFGNQ